jgi:hypothetical protein
MLIGMLALLDAVENANSWSSRIRRSKGHGESPVISFSNAG